MVFVRGEVIGDERLKKKLAALDTRIKRPLRDVIAKGALWVERDAKSSVQRGPKSGRVYQKYLPRRQHQASAPGEPPATDTGKLAALITHVIDLDGLGAQVEAQADYAIHLEFGTVQMSARPFLFPALERNKRKIKRGIDEAVGKTIRR